MSNVDSKKSQLTDFEWQVLAAATAIPLGETRSYKWIAEKIGRPKAVRAVGQALNKNPFAPIIPCHRVIQANGGWGGYAGGLKKKKRLLELEKRIASGFAKSKS
jgi:methylated-DNA-[protein]-cysteine S-methyltransferase